MDLHDLDENSKLQGVTFLLNYLRVMEEEWRKPLHEWIVRFRNDTAHLHWNEIPMDSPHCHPIPG
jgi:hypothetical protein